MNLDPFRLDNRKLRNELQAAICSYGWTVQIVVGPPIVLTVTNKKTGDSIVGVGVDESQAFANLCNGAEGSAQMRDALKQLLRRWAK
jgi:hypothetical protein